MISERRKKYNQVQIILGKLNAHDMPTLSRRSVTGLPKYVRSAWPEIPQNIKMFSSKSARPESSVSITREFQR